QEKADRAEEAIRAQRARSLEGVAPWISKLYGIIERHPGHERRYYQHALILAGVSSARHCESSILAGTSISLSSPMDLQTYRTSALFAWLATRVMDHSCHSPPGAPFRGLPSFAPSRKAPRPKNFCCVATEPAFGEG